MNNKLIDNWSNPDHNNMCVVYISELYIVGLELLYINSPSSTHIYICWHTHTHTCLWFSDKLYHIQHIYFDTAFYRQHQFVAVQQEPIHFNTINTVQNCILCSNNYYISYLYKPFGHRSDRCLFCCSGRIPRLSHIQHSLYVGVVDKPNPPPLTGK